MNIVSDKKTKIWYGPFIFSLILLVFVFYQLSFFRIKNDFVSYLFLLILITLSLMPLVTELDLFGVIRLKREISPNINMDELKASNSALKTRVKSQQLNKKPELESLPKASYEYELRIVKDAITIEKLMRRISEKYEINARNRTIGELNKILLANKVINEELHHAISRFNQLRIIAVHGIKPITKEEAMLAEGISKNIILILTRI